MALATMIVVTPYSNKTSQCFASVYSQNSTNHRFNCVRSCIQTHIIIRSEFACTPEKRRVGGEGVCGALRAAVLPAYNYTYYAEVHNRAKLFRKILVCLCGVACVCVVRMDDRHWAPRLTLLTELIFS